MRHIRYFIIAAVCAASLAQVSAFAADVPVADGADVSWAAADNTPKYTGTLTTGIFRTTADAQNIAGVTIDNAGNIGTLTFAGSSTVTAAIGDGDSRIAVMNLNGAGDNVQLQAFANVANLNFGGDGTLTLGGGSFITGIATTAGDGTGTVTINNGASLNVYNPVGAEAAYIAAINNDGDLTFDSAGGYNVYVRNINTAGGTTVFAAGGKNYYAGTGAGITGLGTLTLGGSSSIYGNVGASAAPLNIVNAGAAGTTSLFSRPVFSNALNITGTGSAELEADSTVTTTAFAANNGTLILHGGTDLTGNITATNAGTLTLQGASVVDGTIGTDAANRLAAIGAGANGSASVLNHTAFAAALNFSGTGSVELLEDSNITTIAFAANDGTFILDDGVDLTGNITATDVGTLTLGGTHTITGAIGGVTALKMIELAGSGATVTQTGNVAAKGLTLSSNALNITGTFTQSANGTITSRVNSSSSYGNITATGAATIPVTASVTLDVQGYVASGSALTIVNATGGTGVRANIPVTSNSFILSFASASSDSEDLTITATRSNSYNDIATNGNTAAAGAALEAAGAVGASGDMLTVLIELDELPSASDIEQALQTLTPVVDSGTNMAATCALDQFVGTTLTQFENRLAPSVASAGATGISTGGGYLKGVDVWGQGFGNYAHQDARGLSSGYNASLWGIAMGGDAPMYRDALRAGASGGFAQSFVRSKDNSGRTDIDSYQGTLYGGYQGEGAPYYIDAAFSFAYNTYNGSRHIGVGAIDRMAYADYDGQQYSVMVRGGYTYKLKRLNITPLASVQYMRLHVGSYTETGANALNLSVASQDYDMAETGLGAKFEYPLYLKYGTLVPEVHAKWLYDWIGDAQATNSTFAGGGGSFATTGFDPAQSGYDFGARLTMFTKNALSLAANYDFEVKEDYWAHTGFVEATYKL